MLRRSVEGPSTRGIAAGELRAYRYGKTIRIKTDDLEAMMRPVPSAKDW